MGFAKISPKFYGDRPTITGDRKVPSSPASKAASPPIVIDRHFRNGKYPDAGTFSMMNEHVNQAMLHRTKEAFSAINYSIGAGAAGTIASSSGEDIRWRWAFHTSPYTHALWVRCVMNAPTVVTANDTYARLRIFSDATESTEVANVEFHYGAYAGTTLGWQALKIIEKFVDGLDPDTTYYARLSDNDYSMTQSISAADIQSMTENYDGYLPQNFTPESKILDSYRENLVTPLPGMWKRGGAKVLNWNSDPNWSPVTIAVNTATNLIDGTSTTYGAAIPGYQLDMTGKARLSQSGVPVRMHAHMSCTSASNGVIHLRDSAGAVVATCTNTYGAGVGGWITTTATLPASSAKYYLTYQTAAGTLSANAVSIYEYE